MAKVKILIETSKKKKEKNKSDNKLRDDGDSQALVEDVNSVPSIYPRDNVAGDFGLDK